MADEARRSHLICSVGRGSYDRTSGKWSYNPTSYRLGSRQETSSFAPAALARLLKLTGARATILATSDDQVRQRAGELAAELQDAGLEPAIVDIPDGRDEAEIYGIFDALVNAVRPEEEVILDVSFALRHLPFVYLAALTYLSALRGVPVAGIYNGPFELRDPETNVVDLVDLRPLLDLTNWYHAVQTANESGDLRRIAELLSAWGTSRNSQMAMDVSKLARALAAGLPVESGIKAARLRTPMRKVMQDPATSLPLRLGLDLLEQRLAGWAVPPARLAKRDIILNQHELQRQLDLAKWYAERQAVPNALLVLREWVVNFALWSQGQTERWLDRDERQRAERAIWALVERGKDRTPSPRQHSLTLLWDQLANRRNELAHAGMRAEEIRLELHERALRELLAQAEQLLEDGALTFGDGQTTGTLLVSALGNSPGLLFSAVSLLEPRPDRLIVLVSKESRARLPEALERAGRPDLLTDDMVLEMADVFAGYGEYQRLTTTALRLRLAAATEVVVNLTGGTTVMQYVVSKIGTAAATLGVQVRQIALVDRRPMEVQRANPYVLGELIAIGQETPEEER